jgi:hypothetical protein
MLPKSRFRVSRHTADHVNQDIRRQLRSHIEYFMNAGSERIDVRLKELDEEWDIERTLEANAAAVSLAGLVLGKTVNEKFYLLSFGVAGFLLQHALQGWCPPLPLFRRLGIRTTEEINAERYALKLIRGDFRGTGLESDHMDAEAIMAAVEANHHVAAPRRPEASASGGMPKRDVTGECEGECRDRVREGEDERQSVIEAAKMETPETISVPGAEKRREQPGVYGGHI